MAQPVSHVPPRARTLAWACAAPVIVVVAAASQPLVDPRILFLDPATQDLAGAPRPWLGLISTLGAALMAGAAIAAGYAALRQRGRARAAAAFAAAFSALLCADDYLMLHEEVFPAAGVHEILVLCLYAGLGAASFFAARAWMAQLERTILFAALTALAASLTLDFITELAEIFLPAALWRGYATDRAVIAWIVMEDGAKFVGLWLWALSHARAALNASQ